MEMSYNSCPRLEKATVGKVGMLVSGPKKFLNNELLLGEIALCIARDDSSYSQPCIWIFGSLSKVEEFIYYSKEESIIPSIDVDLLFNKIDSGKNIILTHIERLACALSIKPHELREALTLAQVSISAPIDGLMEYSSGDPKWISKQLETDSYTE